MRKHLTLIFLCLCFLCHARNTNVLYNAVFDSLYIEGLCYKSADSADLALERFLECEKLDEKNAALSFELSKIYTAKKDSAQALSYLKKAYALDKENYFYAICLAELYDDTGDYASAIKIYEKITKRFPKKTNVLYRLARSYALNNELKKSIKVLEKLENRVGQNSKIVTKEKARLYLYINNYKKAIKTVDGLIKKYPVDADLLVFRGEIKMQTKDIEGAINDYIEALKLDINCADAQMALCGYYSEIMDTENLEFYLQLILANENIDIESKTRYIEFAVNFYRKFQNYEDIIEQVFETVIKANPESVDALLMYAEMLMSFQNVPKAIEVFHSAVLLDEKCLVCWQRLVSAKINEDAEGKIDGVKEILSQALSHFPDDPYMLFVQGGIFLDENETVRAFETLKKSLEGIDPKSKIAESIYIMMSQMHSREALLMARDGIMLFPNNLMLLNNYAYNVAICWAEVCEEKPAEELVEYRKFFDEAEKISESTVKADAINPYYLDTYAYILFLQGKYTLAKFYAEQALNYDKEANAEVFEHYGDILNAMGNKESALKYWKQAFEIEPTEKLLNKIKQNEK